MTDPTGELNCLTLAARQLGAVHRMQALSAGMSPREIEVRLEKGLWSAPQRGVYVVAGVPESWEQLAMIAQLRGGPKAVLSHLTAAHLLDLSPLRPVLIDLTRPRALKAVGIRAHRGCIAGVLMWFAVVHFELLLPRGHLSISPVSWILLDWKTA
jgi:hypothetical protein